VFDWMPEYRKSFWRQRDNKRGSIALAGDSLTEGWPNVAHDFEGAPVANLGIGGDVSRGLLFRFEEDVLALHPRAIVMLIGINDLTGLQSASETLANIRAIVRLRDAHSPRVPMVLCTVPPSSNAKAPVDERQRTLLNQGIRAMLSPENRLFVVDLFAATAAGDGMPELRYFSADHLHLSVEGYARWKEILLPALRSIGVL
jgi:lysophospholipase L1-like esterase